ncbi:hypothetical protein K501DRAFT_333852 [Backusella circina FSU 941]|nr:hypothetical protein K501DRAFT_333852 [Backusella circina FSU 941]
MNPSRNNSSENSLPNTPPPSYTSSLENTRVFLSNIPINQLESTSSDRTYQRVNGSVSRIQFPPPTPSNSMDKSLDVHSKLNNHSKTANQINIPKTNTSSSINSFKRRNVIPAESSFNEGLERIEMSLQQLIDDAQESLKTGLLGPTNFVQQSQKWFQSESEDENPNNKRAIRSNRSSAFKRDQRLYRQSQERLNIAFQQLDESVQSMSPKTSRVQNKKDEKKERKHSISTTTTHHIHNVEDRDFPDKNDFSGRKYKLWLIGLAIFATLCSIKPLYKLRYDVLFIALSVSLYRRRKRQQNKNHFVVNAMDRVVIKLALKKETPSILGWIHRANVMIRFSRVIRAIRWTLLYVYVTGFSMFLVVDMKCFNFFILMARFYTMNYSSEMIFYLLKITLST